MVGLGGFEPPTSPLSGVRSNQLSYRPRVLLISYALIDAETEKRHNDVASATAISEYYWLDQRTTRECKMHITIDADYKPFV